MIDFASRESKNKLKILIKIIISLSFLIYLLSTIKFKQIVDILVKVNILYVSFAFLLVVVGALFSAKKWQLLLNVHNVRKSYLDIAKLYFIGMFFNSFLPSEIGGDVVKGYRLGKSIEKTEVAFSSIFMDRFLGIVALFFFGTLSSLIIFYKSKAISSLSLTSLLILMCFVSVTWMYFSNKGLAVATKKLINPLFMIFERFELEKKLKEVYLSINYYFKNIKSLYTAILISLLFQFISIFCVFIISRAFGYSVNFLYFFLIVPIINCIVIIPISIHGIGLRETAFVLLFSQVGVSKAGAFSISVTVYFIILLTNLIGGLIYFTEN